MAIQLFVGIEIIALPDDYFNKEFREVSEL